MGLDISICVNNPDNVFDEAYENGETDYYDLHSLSRTFCHLICRKDAIEGLPELDQIGKITGTDISPLYEMEQYSAPDFGDFMYFSGTFLTQKENNEHLIERAAQNSKLHNNIDQVLMVINSLLDRLSGIDNLAELLDDHGEDTLDNKVYFSRFQEDTGDGYIGNNFGQDLRNFKRFLEYAKGRGTTSVFFDFG